MMTQHIVSALLLLAAPVVAVAQAVPDIAVTNAAFVTRVKDATARYRDRGVAVRDGYRRIGPNFPGMGEHWISVPLLLDGRVDPDRPPLLEYAMLDGAVTLIGAAFAVLLPAHEPPPAIDGLVVDASVWHFHGGTVTEESFVAGHAHGASVNHQKPRVAVLHVWAWLDNPAGPFATDNWALAFARLGLEVPRAQPSAEVVHGLSLGAGGEPYYLRVIAMSNPAREPRPDVPNRLARSAAEIRDILKQEPLQEALRQVEQRWVELRNAVPGLP